MTNELQRMYRRFRKNNPSMLVGYEAAHALRAARIYLRFQELEALGLVRIRVESDDSYNYHDFDGAEKCNESHPCSECEAIARGDGPVGTIGEWRPDDDSEWETADSCWGHVGYSNPASPFENCYVIDHMAAAVEAYENSIPAANL